MIAEKFIAALACAGVVVVVVALCGAAPPGATQRTAARQQAISVQRQISPPDTRYREPITVKAKPKEDGNGQLHLSN